MAIAITVSLGTGAMHQIQSQDFADAEAAFAALSSSGFLLVPNPIDLGQSQSDGKSRLISGSDIHAVRTI